MPRQVRQCFAAMVAFGALQDVPRLWDMFKARMLHRDARGTAQQLENRDVSHIQHILHAARQELLAYGVTCVESAVESSQISPSADAHRSQPAQGRSKGGC
uniref:Rab-GAP TBC domain-containing protein n=1 Tax=Ascaris lumbricoides TaxID=6252 RepID=A0A0M3IKL6_ASCLU